MVLYLLPTSSSFRVNGIANTPIEPKRCLISLSFLFIIQSIHLLNLPNPVINRTIVNEMYSGMNELTSIPVATIIRAINEVFLRPILSESVPKAYDAKNIALIYMLPVSAT